MVCSVNQYFSGFFVGVSRFYLSNICYVNRDGMKLNVTLMKVFRLRKIKRTLSRAICDWKDGFSHKFKEFQRVSRRQRT